MPTKQLIVRKGTFDAGHRVMNERFKCFNVHGHTYLYELVFEFDQSLELGYAIDFKEIKRVGCQWIDDNLDHGMLLNPEDRMLYSTCVNLNSKVWMMSLNGAIAFCNPTVENIAKEIFQAMFHLFEGYEHLRIREVILYETPNCYTRCTTDSVSAEEAANFFRIRGGTIRNYTKLKGVVEYDASKAPPEHLFPGIVGEASKYPLNTELYVKCLTTVEGNRISVAKGRLYATRTSPTGVVKYHIAIGNNGFEFDEKDLELVV